MSVIRRTPIIATLVALSACADQQPTTPGIRAAAGGGTGGVTVSAANPNSAPQDTTLDVHVLGSGYDRGSQAQWAQNGVPSPNVKTNATRFVSSTELVANITIAIVAATGSYDIVVTTSKGKKGIGTELFAVNPKKGAPTPPPDPSLAFFNDYSHSLLVMNVDGSNVTTLLPGGVYSGPSWAPTGDGSATNPYHLVFTNSNDGTCPLGMIDVDTSGGTVRGSNYRPLPTGNAACTPAWSPRGDEIAYGGVQESGDPKVLGPSSIFVISATGGVATALYTAPQGNAVFWPAWRSDGTAIAFQEYTSNSLYALKVFNRTTGITTEVVPFGAFFEIRSVSWARTGDLLAFSASRMVHNHPRQEIDTLRLARDGNGDFVVAGAPGVVVGGGWPSWSPNDAQLVFDGITVFDLASGTIRNLTTGRIPDWRR